MINSRHFEISVKNSENYGGYFTTFVVLSYLTLLQVPDLLLDDSDGSLYGCLLDSSRLGRPILLGLDDGRRHDQVCNTPWMTKVQLLKHTAHGMIKSCRAHARMRQLFHYLQLSCCPSDVSGSKEHLEHSQKRGLWKVVSSLFWIFILIAVLVPHSMSAFKLSWGIQLIEARLWLFEYIQH